MQQILNILVAFDQLAYTIVTLGYGMPDETLSSAAYRVDHKGFCYDWLGLLVFVLPWRLGNLDRYFCSEAIAAALGFNKPYQYSPQLLMLACQKTKEDSCQDLTI